MLGCRAIYHDGWKAVTFHPMVGFAYEGSDPALPFDDDVWELYHVAEDFSETDDLAAEEPERLRQLVELWWSEAERNQALPLNNQPGRHGDRRYRRSRYEYHAGIGVLPAAVAPNLRNRGFRITADLDLPDGGADGVIVTHGGAAGGYALYLQDGGLHWTYNWLGARVTTISSESALPPDACTVAHDVHARPVASRATSCCSATTSRSARATCRRRRRSPTASSGSPSATSAAPRCRRPTRRRSPSPTASCARVVIEPDGREYRDPPAEEQAAVAMQ